MNRILTVPFLRGTLRISRTPAGDVHKVCVNDLCGAMRRSILLKNGTVLRRCRRLRISMRSIPEELYADFTEAVELVKWMSSGANCCACAAEKCWKIFNICAWRRTLPQRMFPKVPHHESSSWSTWATASPCVSKMAVIWSTLPRWHAFRQTAGRMAQTHGDGAPA